MVALLDLWLPIVLSAVFVFVASSVIHMVTPMHKKDFHKLPDEEGVLAALRGRGIAPGSYMFPHRSSMKEIGSPEFDAKLKQGLVGTMTIRPSGSVSMGPSLAQWFALSLVVAVFVAYVAGRALGPGVDPGRVMQIASAVAFAGVGLTQVNRDATKSERLTQARFGSLWSSFARFGPDDFGPALEFMKTRTFLDDQLIALSVAFDSYVDSGRKDVQRRRLKRAASRTPELKQRLSSLLKPPPQSDKTRKMKKMTADWARRAREREERAARRAEVYKRNIEENLEAAVLAPDLDPARGITSAQHYLMEEARRRHEESDTQYGRNLWRALIPDHGERVARAFRDAAVGFWRRANP